MLRSWRRRLDRTTVGPPAIGPNDPFDTHSLERTGAPRTRRRGLSRLRLGGDQLGHVGGACHLGQGDAEHPGVQAGPAAQAAERDVVDEHPSPDLGEVDAALDGVAEGVERALDVVAVETEVERSGRPPGPRGSVVQLRKGNGALPRSLPLFIGAVPVPASPPG